MFYNLKIKEATCPIGIFTFGFWLSTDVMNWALKTSIIDDIVIAFFVG